MGFTLWQFDIANWKITMLAIGRSPISMEQFPVRYFSHYQSVPVRNIKFLAGECTIVTSFYLVSPLIARDSSISLHFTVSLQIYQYFTIKSYIMLPLIQQVLVCDLLLYLTKVGWEFPVSSRWQRELFTATLSNQGVINRTNQKDPNLTLD